MSSDSNYAAVTRHRRPMSTAARPFVLELVDDEWAADTLSDDEVDVARQELMVAPLLEDGDLEADAIVVSPAGNSGSAASNAAERRRREEGWTDLGLDQIDSNDINAATTTTHRTLMANATRLSQIQRTTANNNTTTTTTTATNQQQPTSSN